MSEEINENIVKELFKHHGFHVTPSNVNCVAGLFCVEWGDFVTDYSEDGKYMQYIFARNQYKLAEDEYLDLCIKETASLRFDTVRALEHHITIDIPSHDYMSFGALYN
jgi:hypothetical protein